MQYFVKTVACITRSDEHRTRKEAQRKKFQGTLTMVNIQKSPPTVPKIIPNVLVLNARSLAKPDTLPALYAELTSKNIDICVV